jgi:hypothetical protein
MQLEFRHGLLTAGAGAVLGWAALTRPSFQYLPVALAAAAWFVAPRNATARRRGIVLLAVFAAALTPWLLYNAVYLKMLTFTPAGGIGRTLWEGTWQVALPGRVESTLTAIADTTADRAALDEKVRAYAGQVHLDPAPMLQYVHQWQDIRRIWTEPQEPWARARARIAADREYLRVGVENIRRDPVRHVWRRATRGVLLLWVTEIPIRYSDINALSTTTIRAIWLPQGILIAAAFAGLFTLWRLGARVEASAFAALILYVTAVHAVLYSEARYALPAKPVVLLLATIAVSRLFGPPHRPLAAITAPNVAAPGHGVDGRQTPERANKLPPSQSQTEARAGDPGDWRTPEADGCTGETGPFRSVHILNVVGYSMSRRIGGGAGTPAGAP